MTYVLQWIEIRMVSYTLRMMSSDNLGILLLS